MVFPQGWIRTLWILQNATLIHNVGNIKLTGHNKEERLTGYGFGETGALEGGRQPFTDSERFSEVVRNVVVRVLLGPLSKEKQDKTDCCIL